MVYHPRLVWTFEAHNVGIFAATLLMALHAGNAEPIICRGYSGPGGPCYSGPGGGLYSGPGGGLYYGPSGGLYPGPGGGLYIGPGGGFYANPSGGGYLGPPPSGGYKRRSRPCTAGTAKNC